MLERTFMRGISLLLALCASFAGAGLIDSQRSLDKYSKQVFVDIDKSIQRADEVTYKHTDTTRQSTEAARKSVNKDLQKAVKRSKTAIY